MLILAFIVVAYALLYIYLGTLMFLNREAKCANVAQKNKAKACLSLVVAVRNESQNIYRLLESIARLKELPNEIIFVNDASTDTTGEILNQFSLKYSIVKIVEGAGEGKKRALWRGVQSAAGDYIVFTDGDCELESDYFSVLRAYLQQTGADMVLGAVDYVAQSGLIKKLDRLEFNTLQAMTLSTYLAGYPSMCNGANLVVKKDKYELVHKKIRADVASGDDMFILHAFKEAGYKIGYLVDREFVVRTQSTGSLLSILNQRVRWAAKAGYYSEVGVKTFMIFILAANLYPLLLFCSCYIEFVALFTIKFVADFFIMAAYIYKRSDLKLLIYTPLLEILYLPYLVVVGAKMLFYNNKKSWK